MEVKSALDGEEQVAAQRIREALREQLRQLLVDAWPVLDVVAAAEPWISL